MSEVKIASEKGCPHCWGSGVIELSPLYYVACFHCGGTGEKQEGAGNEN